eukprot:sb/3460996/
MYCKLVEDGKLTRAQVVEQIEQFEIEQGLCCNPLYISICVDGAHGKRVKQGNYSNEVLMFLLQQGNDVNKKPGDLGRLFLMSLLKNKMLTMATTIDYSDKMNLLCAAAKKPLPQSPQIGSKLVEDGKLTRAQVVEQIEQFEIEQGGNDVNKKPGDLGRLFLMSLLKNKMLTMATTIDYSDKMNLLCAAAKKPLPQSPQVRSNTASVPTGEKSVRLQDFTVQCSVVGHKRIARLFLCLLILLQSDPDLPGPDIPKLRFSGRINFPRYRKLMVFHPDIPGTPIYRAKPFPPRIPVNRGPTGAEMGVSFKVQEQKDVENSSSTSLGQPLSGSSGRGGTGLGNPLNVLSSLARGKVDEMSEYIKDYVEDEAFSNLASHLLQIIADMESAGIRAAASSSVTTLWFWCDSIYPPSIINTYQTSLSLICGTKSFATVLLVGDAVTLTTRVIYRLRFRALRSCSIRRELGHPTQEYMTLVVRLVMILMRLFLRGWDETLPKEGQADDEIYDSLPGDGSGTHEEEDADLYDALPVRSGIPGDEEGVYDQGGDMMIITPENSDVDGPLEMAAGFHRIRARTQANSMARPTRPKRHSRGNLLDPGSGLELTEIKTARLSTTDKPEIVQKPGGNVVVIGEERLIKEQKPSGKVVVIGEERLIKEQMERPTKLDLVPDVEDKEEEMGDIYIASALVNPAKAPSSPPKRPDRPCPELPRPARPPPSPPTDHSPTPLPPPRTDSCSAYRRSNVVTQRPNAAVAHYDLPKPPEKRSSLSSNRSSTTSNGTRPHCRGSVSSEGSIVLEFTGDNNKRQYNGVRDEGVRDSMVFEDDLPPPPPSPPPPPPAPKRTTSLSSSTAPTAYQRDFSDPCLEVQLEVKSPVKTPDATSVITEVPKEREPTPSPPPPPITEEPVPPIPYKKSIWTKMEDQSPMINVSQMEHFFAAKESHVFQTQNKPKEPEGPRLDAKRSQNIGIFLHGAGVDPATISMFVSKVSSDNIKEDTRLKEHIPSIKKLAPTYEDVLEYQKVPESAVASLDRSRQTMWYMVQCPWFTQRIHMIDVTTALPDDFEEVKGMCNDLQSAITCLLTNASFIKFLEVVLTVGNMMNASVNTKKTSHSFKLTQTLPLLSDVRSPLDRAFTLLDFIVQECVRISPEVDCLSFVKDFEIINSASQASSIVSIGVEVDVMMKDLNRLLQRTNEMGATPHPDKDKATELTGFLNGVKNFVNFFQVYSATTGSFCQSIGLTLFLFLSRELWSEHWPDSYYHHVTRDLNKELCLVFYLYESVHERYGESPNTDSEDFFKTLAEFHSTLKDTLKKCNSDLPECVAYLRPKPKTKPGHHNPMLGGKSNDLMNSLKGSAMFQKQSSPTAPGESPTDESWVT